MLFKPHLQHEVTWLVRELIPLPWAQDSCAFISWTGQLSALPTQRCFTCSSGNKARRLGKQRLGNSLPSTLVYVTDFTLPPALWVGIEPGHTNEKPITFIFNVREETSGPEAQGVLLTAPGPQYCCCYKTGGQGLSFSRVCFCMPQIFSSRPETEASVGL